MAIKVGLPFTSDSVVDRANDKFSPSDLALLLRKGIFKSELDASLVQVSQEAMSDLDCGWSCDLM